MTDEIPISQESPKPKQFIILLDEVTMAILGRILPSLQFIPIEGMDVQGQNHMVLVTPSHKVTDVTAVTPETNT